MKKGSPMTAEEIEDTAHNHGPSFDPWFATVEDLQTRLNEVKTELTETRGLLIKTQTELIDANGNLWDLDGSKEFELSQVNARLDEVKTELEAEKRANARLTARCERQVRESGEADLALVGLQAELDEVREYLVQDGGGDYG